MRKKQDYILLYFKGIGMGAADIVPGVSGGTVAFLTGIYDEFLHTLQAIDTQAFRLLTRGDFRKMWKRINGPFLVTLLAGIGTSLFTFARLMTFLIQHHPVYIRSFFFGLILISVPLILREIKKWSLAPVVVFCAGVGISYLLTILSPSHSPEALWFVFIAGALAIGSMVVPGISGAFILMLLGQYHFMITALHEFALPAIIVFSLGCLCGLLLYARIIASALDNYHSGTVALLAGFMLGSLNKVWPWRETLEFVTSSKGLQIPVHDKSILPWHYLTVTGRDPQIFQAVLMMALGVFIVVLTEKIAARLKTKI